MNELVPSDILSLSGSHNCKSTLKKMETIAMNETMNEWMLLNDTMLISVLLLLLLLLAIV